MNQIPNQIVEKKKVTSLRLILHYVNSYNPNNYGVGIESAASDLGVDLDSEEGMILMNETTEKFWDLISKNPDFLTSLRKSTLNEDIKSLGNKQIENIIKRSNKTTVKVGRLKVEDNECHTNIVDDLEYGILEFYFDNLNPDEDGNGLEEACEIFGIDITTVKGKNIFLSVLNRYLDFLEENPVIVEQFLNKVKREGTNTENIIKNFILSRLKQNRRNIFTVKVVNIFNTYRNKVIPGLRDPKLTLDNFTKAAELEGLDLNDPTHKAIYNAAKEYAPIYFGLIEG